jgi:hypothetical protein
MEGGITKCVQLIEGEVVISTNATIFEFCKVIHINANGFAISGVIMREGHPITFESKKLARA